MPTRLFKADCPRRIDRYIDFFGADGGFHCPGGVAPVPRAAMVTSEIRPWATREPDTDLQIDDALDSAARPTAARG